MSPVGVERDMEAEQSPQHKGSAWSAHTGSSLQFHIVYKYYYYYYYYVILLYLLHIVVYITSGPQLLSLTLKLTCI